MEITIPTELLGLFGTGLTCLVTVTIFLVRMFRAENRRIETKIDAMGRNQDAKITERTDQLHERISRLDEKSRDDTNRVDQRVFDILLQDRGNVVNFKKPE